MTTANRSATAEPISPARLAALEADLRRRMRGEVRFDAASRAMYSTDASNYRQVPIGVVIPRDEEDIIAAVAVARQHDAPVLARGGGTSLAGQCCNVAVVIDCSKYVNRVLEIDPDRRLARVQPGTILDDLRNAAVQQYGLTFGPDPATHNHCTLGGMLGNNSCGVHAVMAGRTADNVHELDILTYDGTRMTVGPTSPEELERLAALPGRVGEIYRGLRNVRDGHAEEIRRRYPDIPRRVSGYNLDELLPEHGFNVARALVGSEGTCAMILGATLKLVPNPKERVLCVLGYEDVFHAADHVTEIMKHGPIGLEGIDRRLIENMGKKHLHLDDIGYLPPGNGWLLVEFGADSKDEAEQQARDMLEALGDDGPTREILVDDKKQSDVWDVRESGLGATARVPGEPDAWPGWEDAAVPPERLGEYLREYQQLYDRYGYHGALYGHFGQGCVHTRTDFDLLTAEGLQRYRAFVGEAAALVVSMGGSLSGEHGDGQSRAELLPKMFGHEIVGAFREFKSVWDPAWKMNPGKVVDPHGIISDLRLGTEYDPPARKTYFQFPEDDGSFIRGALRCVGVGRCRRLDADSPEGSTMCPSFMVTREEKDSTRGRARLLFEVLNGRPPAEGWRDDGMRDALDLCLACKGCKNDCPVNVDMATYKAEYLSHYYERRLRPRTAYSLGLIYWWARAASHAPRVVNFFSQTPGLRWIAKKVAGIAQERQIPAFAHEPFSTAFQGAGDAGAPRVILWPDTFNNYIYPGALNAAAAALADAGYCVVIPRTSLCCGRPLYDYGMLETAKGLLRQTLEELRPEIEAGTPIVGVEPSCVAVFRDELVNLFPHDQMARRLSQQTFVLSEFLVKADYRPPQLDRRAIVHGHCHHKAVMGLEDEREMLERLGLDFEVLASGCCGMAGSFGFEAEHYETSIAVGEHSLLPVVRKADRDALVITNGFSCREQIRQGTPRDAMTLGEVIQLALGQRVGAAPSPRTRPARADMPAAVHERRAVPEPAGAGDRGARSGGDD